MQSLPQQFGKEMVIAVPTPLVIQRDNEQVGVFEIFQGFLPGSRRRTQNSVTQRAAHAVKDGCAQQKSLDAFGLLLQDFFNQIVQHEMVAAGERFDETGGILMSLHGKRGQLQAGNPAFGAGFQCGDVFRREVQAHHLVEKLGGFGGGKTQVGGAQFGQLTPGAQPGQGQMWILTGGDDQVHLWRQVLEQKGEGFVNRFGINHMVVVQDEDEIVRDGGDFIEQGCQNRFDWRWLRGLEHTQHPFSNIRRNRLQSSDEVSQKAGGVVIPFVQRQPGDRSPATGDPFADQRGFAKAGGGRDEGQFAARRETLVQPLDQAGAEDNVRPRWGDIKFGEEKWLQAF